MPAAGTIAVAIAVPLAARTGWQRSRIPAQAWPADGQGLSGNDWAVAALRTEVLPGHRATSAGVPGEKTATARSTLLVRFASVLRPDAVHDDYEAATTTVLAELLTVIAATNVAGFGELTLQEITHQAMGRWVLTSITMTVVHLLTVRS